MKIPQIQ